MSVSRFITNYENIGVLHLRRRSRLPNISAPKKSLQFLRAGDAESEVIDRINTTHFQAAAFPSTTVVKGELSSMQFASADLAYESFKAPRVAVFPVL